ncbi:MAG: hypothetical protein LC664_12910 [Flavobacteriales bacterium]|nr:hypothetical protein [Flavobacteriales bacterium]
MCKESYAREMGWIPAEDVKPDPLKSASKPPLKAYDAKEDPNKEDPAADFEPPELKPEPAKPKPAPKKRGPKPKK